MVEFKVRADEYIWRKYHIEVEHLCATRDGQKVTYEKMFYHVPKRKPKKCGGGALQAGVNPGLPDVVAEMVSVRPQTSGNQTVRRAYPPSAGAGAKSSRSTICGFPYQVGPWCQKLKHYWMQGFHRAPPRGAVEIS